MTDVANIDLPYVEKNKSRHGTTRYYLRIDGARICRLPDDINSEEFASAYWKARKAGRGARWRGKGDICRREAKQLQVALYGVYAQQCLHHSRPDYPDAPP